MSDVNNRNLSFLRKLSSAAVLAAALTVVDAIHTIEHTPTDAELQKERKLLIMSAHNAIAPYKLKEMAASCVQGVGTHDQNVGPVASRVAEALKQPTLATNASLEECYNIASKKALETYGAYMQASENVKPSDLNHVSGFQWAFAGAALAFGILMGIRAYPVAQAAKPKTGEPNAAISATPSP